MEILKIKEWKSRQVNAQFTIRSKELIHLHKLNRFITLGCSYPYFLRQTGLTIVFTMAHNDLIHLDYIIFSVVAEIQSRGTLVADTLSYNDGRFL